MKNLLQLPCLVFILISSVPAKAQQSDPIPLNNPALTLRQAWEQAEQTYPGLTGRAAIVGEYQIRKQEVQSRSIPQVQLQVQNTYGTFEGSNGAFFPVPGVFNVTGNAGALENGTKAAASTFGSVLMDWKFFEFGKQRKAIQAADYQFQGAQSSYDAAKLTLKAKVTRLYFDIMFSDASLNWAKQNVTRVHNILDLSISLAKAGLKPGADTSLVLSSYSQALAYQREWQGKYNASKIRFSEVVPAKEFNLPQSAYAVHPATGHSAITSNSNQIITNPDQKIGNPDTITASHPYLQVLDKQVLYEKAQQAVASRKALPSLSLLGGISSRGSAINADRTINTGITSGYNNYANNYLAGIGLSWNISGAYTSSLEKKRAEKTVQASKAKYNLQKLQMNTSLSAITESIVQQQQQLQENNLSFKKATQAYELYLSRYESGLINLTELLQIQSLLQNAEKETIAATQVLWNLLITKAELSGDFNDLSSQFN